MQVRKRAHKKPAWNFVCLGWEDDPPCQNGTHSLTQLMSDGHHKHTPKVIAPAAMGSRAKTHSLVQEVRNQRMRAALRPPIAMFNFERVKLTSAMFDILSQL